MLNYNLKTEHNFTFLYLFAGTHKMYIMHIHSVCVYDAYVFCVYSCGCVHSELNTVINVCPFSSV